MRLYFLSDPSRLRARMVYIQFFFQKYWNNTNEQLSSLVLDAFSSLSIPLHINQTYLCLIPKMKNADSSIHQYRPISLCNTVYKLITKIIANRITYYIPQLISPMQATFTKNRRASDNIIISQEIIKFLYKSKSRKKKGMIIKIDMKKAFDQLE